MSQVNGDNQGKGSGLTPPSSTYGVWGDSDVGPGVTGTTAASAAGVLGVAPDGNGVQGESDRGNGVVGFSSQAAGWHFAGIRETGIYGANNGVVGISGPGPGANATGVRNTGVFGASYIGEGVRGEGGPGEWIGPLPGEERREVRRLGTTGVYGTSHSTSSGASGVFGESRHGVGVRAKSQYGDGVRAQSEQGVSVWARTSRGPVTLYATHPDPWQFAGFFDPGWLGANRLVVFEEAIVGDNLLVEGNAQIKGTFSTSGKQFRIDHPLDPAKKYLNHSSVESPERKNVYDGVASLDANGDAVVELPEWFEELNKDFRYQLTPIGASGPNLYVAEEVNNSRFKIAGGSSEMKVSWQVTGVRKDKWAEANPLSVEEEKLPEQQGLYLHPEVHGESGERRIGMADLEHFEQIRRQMEEQRQQMETESSTRSDESPY